jgi:hypothetical protein
MIISTESVSDPAGRVVLAAASQYTDKYFFNDSLGPIPDEIRKEVLVLLVWATEESGGMTIMGFEEDGSVYLASTAEEGDLGYDEISAGLTIREIEREHADLIEELEQWYREIVRKKG